MCGLYKKSLGYVLKEELPRKLQSQMLLCSLENNFVHLKEHVKYSKGKGLR